MFKKLKDKIAEEVKQSPSKLSATVSQIAQAVVSPNSSSIVDSSFTSDDQFSISEDAEETPQNTPTKSGFMSVDLRETPPSILPGGRSRRSSTNSVMSEASILFPSYDYPGSSFHLQSDLESASELDDSVSSNLTSTSKEQLVSYLRKSQHRYNKYKGRWHDVIRHCKELERENAKAKAILSESQDKALRRIAELKEQCLLEKQAKAHLEEILRNDLEEKDHLIMTLNTKIDLLKPNDSGISSEMSVGETVSASESLIDLSTDSGTVAIPTESDELQKEKVKKLEILLSKCKDAIRIHKEKVKEFSLENDQLKKELASNEHCQRERLQEWELELSVAREKIVMLQQQEEESALSLAETKRTIHSEMEIKEEQIKHLRDNIHSVNDERDALVDKCDQLQNQLAELQRLQELEITSENEKQMQELSRVKQEAVKLLQAESAKNMNDLEASWLAKIQDVETQLKDSLQINKQLEGQCIALQDQTMELEAQKTALMDQVKTSEKQSTDLKDTAVVLDNTYGVLHNQYTLLKEENVSLKDSKSLLEIQNNDLKDQITSLDNHVHALLRKYPTRTSAVENNHSIKQKIDEILSNVQEHRSEVTDCLQTKIDELVERGAEIKQSHDELTKTVRRLTSEVEMRDKVNSSQISTIRELQDSKTGLVDTNNELMKRLQKSDDTNTQIMANEAALRSELNTLKVMHDGEVSSLRSQLEQLKEDCKEHKATMNTLQAKKDELEVKVEELVAAAQQREDEIQKKCTEINNLSTTQLEQRGVVEELNTQITILKRELGIVTEQLCVEEQSGKNDQHVKLTAMEFKCLQEKAEYCDDLNRQVGVQRDELNRSQKVVQTLENERTALIAENQDLSTRVQTYGEQKEQALRDWESAKANELLLQCDRSQQFQQFQEKIAGMMKEMECMAQANHGLQNELESMQACKLKHDELQDGNKEREMQLKSELEYMTKEVTKLKNDNQDLHSELNLVQSSSAIKELELQTKLREKFEIELKAFTKEIEELKRKEQQLLSELDRAQSTRAIEDDKFLSLQQQLNDSLHALQLKENEIIHLEETHISNISQLAKEFQNTLGDKEDELLKAHEEEKAGIEHSEGIQMKQLRDQVKAMKSEAREREEMIESLRDVHNCAVKDLRQELAAAEASVEDVRATCQTELRDTDKKWRLCLEREIEQREASHKEEVQALTEEWQMERKDPKFTEKPHTQELASTSQVAVAAVESGTESIEMMHRQLTALTKELKEAKRCHKLEVAELRRLMAAQGTDGPTEFEYLRNILFEYMMGRECNVLARVIAAVLKFDPEQTSKVVKKLEHEQTLLGQLGII